MSRHLLKAQILRVIASDISCRLLDGGVGHAYAVDIFAVFVAFVAYQEYYKLLQAVFDIYVRIAVALLVLLQYSV